jgi:hypothetical protein
MCGGRLRARLPFMTATTFLHTLLGPAKRIDPGAHELTLRYATPADAEALERLAQLDSAHTPEGTVLTAAVDGDLWAAVSVEYGDAVADPFRPTGELVSLLHERARQMRRQRPRAVSHEPAVASWPHHLQAGT